MQNNYLTTEGEALAIVWVINKFRGYLETAPKNPDTNLLMDLFWFMIKV